VSIMKVLRLISMAPLLVTFAVLGCDSQKNPVVPQAGPGGVNPMAVPQPGVGQTQYGVADAPVQGATAMNAQAMALYRQAMNAWASGDLSSAQALFTQATQADPKAYQAWYSLGAVQERLGASAALNSYGKAFEVAAAYDRAMVSYGLLLAKRGNLSEAESFLTKRRSKLPKSAGLAAALAEVKSLAKDTAGAQAIAQEALKLDPSFAPAMMTIARDHYRNRRLDLSRYAL